MQQDSEFEYALSDGSRGALVPTSNVVLVSSAEALAEVMRAAAAEGCNILNRPLGADDSSWVLVARATRDTMIELPGGREVTFGGLTVIGVSSTASQVHLDVLADGEWTTLTLAQGEEIGCPTGRYRVTNVAGPYSAEPAGAGKVLAVLERVTGPAAAPLREPGQICIRRPVVPHGPASMEQDVATAMYLREVVDKIDTGYTKVGGSNVTATVRALLLDVADTLGAHRELTWRQEQYFAILDTLSPSPQLQRNVEAAKRDLRRMNSTSVVGREGRDDG